MRLARWNLCRKKNRMHRKKRIRLVFSLVENGITCNLKRKYANRQNLRSEVAQSCPTLATPWTAAHQAPPSMGFSRQEYWNGVPLPSPTNLDSIVKSRDIILPTKVRLVKAMVFPIVMYGCESWTIKLSTKELMLLNCDVGEDS